MNYKIFGEKTVRKYFSSWEKIENIKIMQISFVYTVNSRLYVLPPINTKIITRSQFLMPRDMTKVKNFGFKATLYSRSMTSVHSKPVQTGQYALLKTTSQRHCISNVRHDPGYSLDDVTT
jgi:hypothetical protein